MKPFEFQRPEDILVCLQADTYSSKFISGGTNLLDLMKKHIHEPDTLVDVSKVLDADINVKNNRLRIGAMARNSAIAENDMVKRYFPLLSQAILKGASPQIRNMASAGGNLLQRTRCPYFYDNNLPCNKRKPGSGCGALNGENRMAAVIGYSEDCVAVHPSDMCVALVALNAEVEIRKKDGSKEMIAFEDFHRLPHSNPEKDTNLPDGALITALEIPSNLFYNHTSYLKIRDRESYAFALISVAAALDLSADQIKDVRLASGGVAHKPWRWKNAEGFLKDKEANEENFTMAAEIAIADLKPLEHNKFKVPMLKGAIIQALKNAHANS